MSSTDLHNFIGKVLSDRERKSITVDGIRYICVALSELTVKTCSGYKLLDGDSMHDFLQSVAENGQEEILIENDLGISYNIDLCRELSNHSFLGEYPDNYLLILQGSCVDTNTLDFYVIDRSTDLVGIYRMGSDLVVTELCPCILDSIIAHLSGVSLLGVGGTRYFYHTSLGFARISDTHGAYFHCDDDNDMAVLTLIHEDGSLGSLLTILYRNGSYSARTHEPRVYLEMYNKAQFQGFENTDFNEMISTIESKLDTYKPTEFIPVVEYNN